jgi:hypothetical protein
MTLLVKDANTTIQSLSTELDASGNLVPVHAPASVAAGIATPVGPTNPLPVINTAAAAATVANNVASTVDTTIQTACTAYQKGEAAANAVVGTGLVPADAANKVGIIEEYGDAACANPPSGDALSTAIWFGTLVGQIATLTSVTPAT